MSEFRFPADVHGWLTAGEGACLFKLAKGAIVIEVGSWQGRSTICLAQSAVVVFAIDPHRNYTQAADGHQRTFFPFMHNLARYGVEGRVMPLVGFSHQIVPALGHAFADLIFVDGEHHPHEIERDIMLLARCLKVGGTWAFHDYHEPTWPGVAPVVDAFAARLGQPVEAVDHLAIVRTR